MTQIQRVWKIKEKPPEAVISHLIEVLNVPYHIAYLLAQRNISTRDQAKEFFRPDIDRLHDPFLMKDMALAVERIIKAIHQNENILIYGDYDVDGTSAVAMVYSFLSRFTENINFYIPDRDSEGYGVSFRSVDFALEKQITLVITLDCGIKEKDAIAYGQSKGIDYIVCDHHQPDDTLPQAYAILNPKRPDCSYPFKELSGCGVGFKLIQALSKKRNIPFEDIKPYLDLVTLSIAADIVPITGENRILAYYGLERINKNPRPGIEAALKLAGIKRRPESIHKVDYNFTKYITIADLVFSVGPRINAAGRIDSGRNSVLLLLSQTKEEAEHYAQIINDFNNERKNLDKQAFENALQMIESNPELQKKKSTILYNPHWHKGVVGIVASRLIEIYYRPTIIFTESNGLLTGSARSIKEFDLYQAINACQHLIEHFGGHKYAAGLSIKPENFQTFCEEFESRVQEMITEEMLIPDIEIDMELDFADITPKFVRLLKQFAPFGPGNMSPVFLTRHVYDTGYSRPINEHHMKLHITQPHYKGPGFNAIAFGFGQFFEDLHNLKKPFSICYHIEENEYNGRLMLQLNIKDMRIEEIEEESAEDEDFEV